MQNQQNFLQYEPIPLPDDLPVTISSSTLREASPHENFRFICHRHDILEIGLCHSGYGVYAIDSKILPFQTGDITVIGPKESHHARSAPGVRSDWTWIFLDPIRLLGAMCSHPAILHSEAIGGARFRNVLSARQHPEIDQLVRQIIQVLSEPRSAITRDRVCGLCLALLTHIHCLPGIHCSDRSMPQSFDHILPAIDYIHHHYHSKISIADLAKIAHMSVSNFRLRFRQFMECSPLQYIQQYRISMASVELLRGHKTIETIARENGFPTVSSFLRQFARYKRMSPRQWARQQQERAHPEMVSAKPKNNRNNQPERNDP